MLNDPGNKATHAILSRNEMADLVPQWRELVAAAADDNVYYTASYALALLETVDPCKRVDFVTCWKDGRLIALLPVSPVKTGIGPLLNIWRAWRTPYTFSCTPLLDRENGALAAESLVSAMKDFHAGLWIVPLLEDGGATSKLLRDALQRQGAAVSSARHFQRAIFERDLDFETHLQNGMSGKRRRDLLRNRRRLEKLGEFSHEIHMDDPGLTEALEAFLEIEAAGWKGQQGTALACSQDSAAFARRAFALSGDDCRCRADLLRLDGRPIAVSLLLLSGRTGFTVKCAFDEEYRSYSAGLVLELEFLRDFLSGEWANRLDSATAGAHVIDDMWPGRIEIADCVFTFTPLLAWTPAAFSAGLQARKSAKQHLKRFIGRR